MTGVQKFRDIARLMTELEAGVGYSAIIFGRATPTAPGEIYLKLISDRFHRSRWHIIGEPTAMKGRAGKLVMLVERLNELPVVEWRGTLWLQDRDLEDPDAVYLKSELTGFLGLFGPRKWRVSVD
ncbi:hypothetical protein [Phytomonospora endophytica]|uniref:Uncharacterized protein n=1 Tax=Phytomonospora endophytica TaxID=714109 RepID=A0A841G6N1_9ACTN|nr:hypothetical protein [Phytomonospora endophytica]MBB6039730.1 hypothetical protein [Phytomonospora endophytica]